MLGMFLNFIIALLVVFGSAILLAGALVVYHLNMFFKAVLKGFDLTDEDAEYLGLPRK